MQVCYTVKDLTDLHYKLLLEFHLTFGHKYIYIYKMMYSQLAKTQQSDLDPAAKQNR